MKIGFSLSPGGLLLPYHLGVLSGLAGTGQLTPATHLAGSSAGAIAAASWAAGVNPLDALSGCQRVAARCRARGGARGHLLRELAAELDELLPEDAHQTIARRPGRTTLAYRQVFPPMNVLADEFESAEDLKRVIKASSMVPFFSTPWPVTFCRGGMAVDGFFTQPRGRFGCPETGAPRTVTVSVFPHRLIGLEASSKRDSISPQVDSDGQTQVTGSIESLHFNPRRPLCFLRGHGPTCAARVSCGLPGDAK
mmetsp:Transcript_26741/g.59823  ORF Transcript_26741/g.59823 Transcript_26741/m.59823 type:complete len:252 (-) Transcript_26741:723-1478(-)